MRFAEVRNVFVLSLTVLAATGCSVKIDAPIDAKGQINVNGVQVCAVTVQGGNTVETGKAATLSIDVGASIHNKVMYPPYKVSGDTGAFCTQTFSIQRIYTNAGTTDLAVADQVTITDKNNVSESCSFSVTVKPVVVPTNGLLCTTSLSPTSATVNQNVVFTATASGGKAPYAFTNFAAPGSVSVAPFTTNAVVGTATVKFPAAGSNTLSTVLTDAAGNAAVCSRSITVTGSGTVATPSMLLGISPSSVVSVGSPITVTATPSNFTSIPTITFSVTESGINVATTGTNTATLTVTDGQPHTFIVTASATAPEGYATAWQLVQFTAAPTVTCALTHSGSTTVNGDVVFTVAASNGTSVVMTEFNGTAIASPTSPSKTTTFSTSGQKIVTAKGRTVNGTLCNGGATLQDTIYINPVVTTPALSCTVKTNVLGVDYFWDDAFWGTDVQTYAEVTGGTAGQLRVVSVTHNGAYFNGWDANNDLVAYLNYPCTGSYSISMNVKDLATNQQVTCTPATLSLPGWWCYQ